MREKCPNGLIRRTSRYPECQIRIRRKLILETNERSNASKDKHEELPERWRKGKCRLATQQRGKTNETQVQMIPSLDAWQEVRQHSKSHQNNNRNNTKTCWRPVSDTCVTVAVSNDWFSARRGFDLEDDPSRCCGSEVITAAPRKQATFSASWSLLLC